MINANLEWKSLILAQFSAEPRRGEQLPSHPENHMGLIAVNPEVKFSLRDLVPISIYIFIYFPHILIQLSMNMNVVE